jgi:hypothetical protein
MADILTPANYIVSILQSLKQNLNSEDGDKLQWCIDCISSGTIYSPPDYIRDVMHSIKFQPSELLELYSEHNKVGRRLHDEEAVRNMTNRRLSFIRSDSLTSIESLPNIEVEIHNIDMNVFSLAEEVGNNNTTLELLTMKILDSWNLFRIFDIEPKVFQTFAHKVAKGYKDVPYHNALHAADVVHSSHLFLRMAELPQRASLSNIHIAGFLVAALIHDYKHPGLNNSFLEKSGNKLAILYNDISILENYHVSSAFKLMQNPLYNIFEGLVAEEYRIVRHLMINLVLSTDMAKHAQHTAEANQKLIKDKDYSSEKLSILSIFIHAADISNPAKNFEICYAWGLRVTEEFFAQGDMEKNMSLPVTAMFDRDKVTLETNQLGFLQHVVRPYFTPICNAFPGLRQFMINIEANEKEWAARKRPDQ